MVSLFIVYVIHIYVNLYCVHTYIIKTSWRYSDLIGRSFYDRFMFYIVYADIFILIGLCCTAGAATYHRTRYVWVPEASSYWHIKHLYCVSALALCQVLRMYLQNSLRIGAI